MNWGILGDWSLNSPRKAGEAYGTFYASLLRKNCRFKLAHRAIFSQLWNFYVYPDWQIRISHAKKSNFLKTCNLLFLNELQLILSFLPYLIACCLNMLAWDMLSVIYAISNKCKAILVVQKTLSEITHGWERWDLKWGITQIYSWMRWRWTKKCYYGNRDFWMNSVGKLVYQP